jgi:hypothetical protein
MTSDSGPFDESPDAPGLRRRWQSLDEQDPQFEDVFHRIVPLGQLLDESAAVEGGGTLREQLKLEGYLFGAAMRGGSRGLAAEGLPTEFQTPSGIEYLTSRTRSPSVIVNALAFHALWIVARSTYGKAGRSACDAYLRWFELSIDMAVKSNSISWAIQGTNALLAGSALAVETNQRDIQRQIAVSAMDYAVRAYRAGHGRWALECTEAVTKFADKIAGVDLTPLLELVDAMGTDNAERENFHLARSFLLAGSELRRKSGIPIPPSAGATRIAQLFELEAEAALRRESGGAFVANHFYQLALAEYEKTGETSEIQRLRGLLQSSADASVGELKEITVSVPIDAEPVQRLLSEFETREIGECIELIANGGIWRLNVESLHTQQEALEGEFVLQTLVSYSYLGPEGTSHTPNSQQEAKDSRLHRTALLYLKLSMGWLSQALERVCSRKPANADFVDRILRSNLFEETDRPFLERGITHWLAADHLSALHILLPTIERVLRRFARLTGIPTIRLRPGGAEQISIDTALKALDPVLDPALALELRLVLTEPAGWSLRHQIAHGLATPETFNPLTSAAILHLLLWLGTLTVKTAAGPSTSPK